MPLGGAALPVKGCGALTFPRYGNGSRFTDLPSSTLVQTLC